jgi:hypothetical protein
VKFDPKRLEKRQYLQQVKWGDNVNIKTNKTYWIAVNLGKKHYKYYYGLVYIININENILFYDGKKQCLDIVIIAKSPTTINWVVFTLNDITDIKEVKC